MAGGGETRKKVYLVGCGMGNPGTLTGAARAAVDASQLLVGARRLLAPFAENPAEKVVLLRTAEIVELVRAADAPVISVLFSGDTGFFSGASTFLAALASEQGPGHGAEQGADPCPEYPELDIEVIPGISSLQYFCAKAQVNWDDARILSVHGRTCDYVGAVREHAKVFLLTGGTERVHDVCARLAQEGLGHVRAIAGERLSYADERIVRGTAEELARMEFADLAVLMLLNPQPSCAGAGAGAAGKGALLYVNGQPYSGARSQAVPRILVGAPASNTGKTTFTCGLLHALVRRGMRPLACKCGPDYIDPMFHSKVIGAKSRNLDLFFAGDNLVRATLARDARECDVTVIEGAMGFYDGIATGSTASAWDVSRATDTPVVLVVDGRGRALSIAAEVAGFARFRTPSNVAGVVLNRVSAGLYPRLKEAIEAEAGVKVLGYLPRMDGYTLESRHLGLVTAGEVADLREKLDVWADQIERTVDVDALLALARGAAPVLYDEPALPEPVANRPRIAVAADDAFCFYYDDTLRLLGQLGAEVVPFSPLRDPQLPQGTCGIYLGGGYPELHARELSENAAMRESVRAAIAAGVPTVAECGGFLYLHSTLEDDCGAAWPQVGALPARAYKTDKLGRFGYVTLQAHADNLLAAAGETLAAHEFHYWESEDPGSAYTAQKPQATRSWECCIATESLYAGFPHLYLPGAPQAAARFVRACAAWKEGHGL